MGMGPPRDVSQPDPLVSPGTIRVQVVDGSGDPAQDAEVELITQFQSIELGNSEKSARRPVPPAGEISFSGLDSALRYSYVVRVRSGGALYQVAPFRLGKTGHQVLIHIYPTTSDLRQAFVGFRGLTFVQLREDVFHISAMYRVLNMSNLTYLPRGIDIQLPKDAEAVDVENKVGDAGFERDGDKVRLVGTFPPGHGFRAAESTLGPDGKKVLFAQRVMQPGENEMRRVRMELSGLPVVGPGRWVAAAVAASIGLFGLGLGMRRRAAKTAGDEQEQLLARQVLLQEMKLLELAHSREQIGPRTYEQTRREILLALARLEPVAEQKVS
jgi:hypothetical protein